MKKKKSKEKLIFWDLFEKNDSMLLMENVNVCGWTYTARRGVSETLRLLDTVTVVLVALVVGGVVLGLGHFRF
jgi:hypothetical protein